MERRRRRGGPFFAHYLPSVSFNAITQNEVQKLRTNVFLFDVVKSHTSSRFWSCFENQTFHFHFHYHFEIMAWRKRFSFEFKITFRILLATFFLPAWSVYGRTFTTNYLFNISHYPSLLKCSLAVPWVPFTKPHSGSELKQDLFLAATPICEQSSQAWK